MPTLNSHTITHGWFIFKGVREPQAVCQAAPANAQTKAWQRVCLPQRTTKTTDKPADEKEARLPNSGFAKWRVKCFYDSLVQGSSLVYQLNICAKNPPLRKAPKRCRTF